MQRGPFPNCQRATAEEPAKGDDSGVAAIKARTVTEITMDLWFKDSHSSSENEREMEDIAWRGASASVQESVKDIHRAAEE